MFNKVTDIINVFIRTHVHDGSVVVDATCGNGFDTLYLSEIVGINGLVYAFDIDELAVNTTIDFLKENAKNNNYKIINDSHSNLKKYINFEIDACIFNLGYLPKNKHRFITQANSTLEALNSVLDLLAVNGKVYIASYIKHEGGEEEYNALKDVLVNLDKLLFNVVELIHINRSDFAPRIFVVEKFRS